MFEILLKWQRDRWSWFEVLGGKKSRKIDNCWRISISGSRVCQKFCYPLVLWTSTILNLVVRNPRVLGQKVLLKTQKQSGIYFTAYYHIISLFSGKSTGLVTKARFLSHMELVKKQMIEMAVEWRSFKGIFNLILTSMKFAFTTIT